MFMETFEDELWQCPGCGPKFDYSKVKNWKCPSCNDPIWIAAEVNGNNYVFERIKAKEIQKDDVILLDGMHNCEEVKKVKQFGKKIRIYLRNNPAITQPAGTFFNTIIGNWQNRD
jgi:hypothetical protein